MGDLVSLKLKRKDAARREREAKAAENRARFGRSKEERQLAEAQAERDAKRLDQHKRDE